MTEKEDCQRQNNRRGNGGLKEWQWQDKTKSNGGGKRSDNGRIKGVTVTEKEECQRRKKCRGKGQAERNDNDRTGSCDKRSGNGRQRWVAMAGLGGERHGMVRGVAMSEKEK